MRYCRFYDYANTNSWWTRLGLLSERGWQLQSITLIDISSGKILVVMQGKDAKVTKLDGSITGIDYSW